MGLLRAKGPPARTIGVQATATVLLVKCGSTASPVRIAHGDYDRRESRVLWRVIVEGDRPRL